VVWGLILGGGRVKNHNQGGKCNLVNRDGLVHLHKRADIKKVGLEREVEFS